MSEEVLKEMIKDMFINGEIEIKTNIEDDYDGKNIVTRVYIDNSKVYENEEILR